MFNRNKNKPYVIAEIGVNHEGSIKKAEQLIDLAKQGGADAVKFQSYKADTIASVNSPAYWDKEVNPIQNQHQLFKKYDTFDQTDYEHLSNYCRLKKIDFSSTPFDDNSVDYLETLMPFYKISSSDITNIPFIRKISKKNKPIILSTGASEYKEIKNAVYEIRKINSKELCIMHCVLSYPTINSDANLNMIKGLRKNFEDILIGYSDHTKPDKSMLILTMAYLNGAQVIEKHFTDNKELPGNDHFHAMTSSDIKHFLQNIDLINEVGGEIEKKVLPSEEIARKNARRSIVINKSLNINHVINESDITYKRPASGISPEHWDRVIGLKVNKNLELDHILQWDDLFLDE